MRRRLRACLSLSAVILTEVWTGAQTLPPQRVSYFPTHTPLPGNNFGVSTAISDDYAVVSGNGTVDVFDLKNTDQKTPWLHLTEPTVTGRFGQTVKLSGNRLAVSAPGDHFSGSGSSAYVYDLNGVAPSQPVFAIHVPHSRFAASISLLGDRLLIGSPGEKKVFVHDLSSPTANMPSSTLLAPDSVHDFGAAVDMNDNFIAVGAPVLTTPSLGAVYLYPLPSFNSSSPAFTIQVDGEYDFGTPVTLSSNTLVVGNWASRLSKYSIWAYDLSVGSPSSPLVLPVPYVYGWSLASNARRVLVGSAYRPPLFEGAPYPPGDSILIFDLNFTNGSYTLAELDNPAPGDHDNFGYSIAMTSTRILVGTPFDDTVATDAGAAYLFGEPVGPMTANLEVRDLNGALLGSGENLTDFGGVAIGTFESRDFLLTNSGRQTLYVEGLNFAGSHAADFSAVLTPEGVIEPGASVHLVVSFQPQTSEHMETSLQVESNDPAHNPYLLKFTGLGATDQEYWRLLYFGTADNAGAAADDADPDADGENNLFEYVAGLDPLESGSRLSFRAELSPDRVHEVITFSPIAAGRNYSVESTRDPSAGEWEPLNDFTVSDQNGERSVTTEASTTPIFYRVRIARE